MCFIWEERRCEGCVDALVQCSQGTNTQSDHILPLIPWSITGIYSSIFLHCQILKLLHYIIYKKIYKICCANGRGYRLVFLFYHATKKKLEENIPIQINESQLVKLAREFFWHYSYNFFY